MAEQTLMDRLAPTGAMPGPEQPEQSGSYNDYARYRERLVALPHDALVDMALDVMESYATPDDIEAALGEAEQAMQAQQQEEELPPPDDMMGMMEENIEDIGPELPGTEDTELRKKNRGPDLGVGLP